MRVFSVYLARSIAGMGVAVGAGVSVGNSVLVAEGAADAVGVVVGARARDAQEDKNERRKRKRMMRSGVVFFRMG